MYLYYYFYNGTFIIDGHQILQDKLTLLEAQISFAETQESLLINATNLSVPDWGKFPFPGPAQLRNDWRGNDGQLASTNSEIKYLDQVNPSLLSNEAYGPDQVKELIWEEEGAIISIGHEGGSSHG